jgi:hypothetical protein
VTTLILYKDRGALWPAGDDDRVALGRLDSRKPVKAKLSMARNLRRLRLYWAVINRVAENHPFYSLAGSDPLHEYIKMRLGLVDCVVYHDGSTRLKPRSIALDAMQETEFKTFLDRALDVICTEILPGVDRDDLMREAA